MKAEVTSGHITPQTAARREGPTILVPHFLAEELQQLSHSRTSADPFQKGYALDFKHPVTLSIEGKEQVMVVQNGRALAGAAELALERIRADLKDTVKREDSYTKSDSLYSIMQQTEVLEDFLSGVAKQLSDVSAQKDFFRIEIPAFRQASFEAALHVLASGQSIKRIEEACIIIAKGLLRGTQVDHESARKSLSERVQKLEMLFERVYPLETAAKQDAKALIVSAVLRKSQETTKPPIQNNLALLGEWYSFSL